ncbi:hypothetical protein C3942_03375 [Solimonas fluminis]|uniref:DUF1302 domain-containing protein n=1 Tax=Solimonas fluminis TaxID=2086571 RepID=A0A2S5TLR7_9GAMM|nr:DUF1302 family protein [Solimonas fluminis]PPE75935.1 hypothetical protein C3942_03375 [Solimonas fluminis]
MNHTAATGGRARSAGLIAGLLSCGQAVALDYEWRDIDISLNGRASIGAMWRMEERDNRLVGKLNVPGQQGLCSRDDCIDLGGDSEPNQRLVDAQGAYIGHAFDDGNLNYDQYDMTSAVARLKADTVLTWGETLLKLSGVAFFDAVNVDADDYHPDTTHQPRHTKRSQRVERDLGTDIDLLQLYVARSFELENHTVNVSVGQQVLRWGESNLVALNSLAEINPPDENIFWMPGAQLPDAFQAVPLAILSADLTDTVDAELFYQFGWRPAKAAAAGGFMSLFESANGRDHFILTQGQTPEDPDGEHHISGLATLLTDSSATARMIGSNDPEDGGQFGLRLNWRVDELLGGTQFSFYAANYHSRVPYLSMIAGDESCIRDSTTIVGAVLDCPLLLSGSLDLADLLYHYLGVDLSGIPPVDIDLSNGNDALPFDTPKGFLDYPEDIQMYGISFNTTVGSWSLSGEYAYRPNLPLQVALTDVIMTAAQPLFPRQDIVVGLPQLATIPGARTFIPDFLSVYRGYDNSIPERSIQAGQVIRGYERMKVGQFNLSAIKALSPSDLPFPLGTDQILVLLESGITHVLDMPDREQLQFEGFILHKNTHASPGADGTGSGGVPGLRLTPTQQTEGFADDFAWGYRISVMMEYNDVLGQLNMKPWLIWGHDVQGISPLPKSGYQGFAEGRTFFQIGSEFYFLKDWSGGLFYRGSSGSNETLRDRDSLTAYVAYTF